MSAEHAEAREAEVDEEPVDEEPLDEKPAEDAPVDEDLPVEAAVRPVGPVALPVPPSVAVPDPVPVPAARRGGWRGRLLRGGLLAAAVAAIVALDTGAVPLPYSTPVAPALSAPGDPSSASADRVTVEQAAARDAAVDALLATMTSAYAADDEAAFLSVVDPGDPDLVQRLRTVFRNLRAIGYEDVRFAWPGRTAYAPVTPRDKADPAATVPAVLAVVELTTRIPGFDPEPAVDLLGWTFAQRGDGWVLAADTDRDNLFRDWLDSQPWMVGPVSVVKRKNVLVIGEPAKKAALRRLADRLEASRASVRAAWKVPSWNGRVVAYALTDKDFVYYHFGTQAATGERTKEAQFDAKVTMLFGAGQVPAGGAGAGDTARPVPATPRMVVTPFLMERDDAESRAVLTHEMTHVAWAFEGGDSTPAWLVEGIAEYTGYRTGGSSVDGVGALARRGLPREMWTQLRRGTWKPALVADPSAFYTGTSRRVGGTYTTAWLTCLYIADEFGEQTLAELYEAAEAAADDRDPEQIEAEILRKVLDTDRKALTRDVVRYAERIRGAFV